MSAAQQSMWGTPLSPHLRRAAAASTNCCKQLLHNRAPLLQASGWQLHQQQQQQLCAATACRAVWVQAQSQQYQQQRLMQPLVPCPHHQRTAPRISHTLALQQTRFSGFTGRVATSTSAAVTAAAAEAAAAAAAGRAVGGDAGTAVATAAGAQPAAGSSSSSKQASKSAQTLDYTTLVACCDELAATWVPSKVEEVVQPDKFTLVLRLRTPLAQGWLHLSWHPTAARLCVGRPPARGDVAEGFALAQQVSSHLKGLVLVSVSVPVPWERVAQLEFGPRPSEPPSRRLYCEIMSKYSNVVLTDAAGVIQLCAYQVGGAMSSLRQVQQSRGYQLPPRAQGIEPSPTEPFSTWQQNITRAAALAAAAPPPHRHGHNNNMPDNKRLTTAQPAAPAAVAAKPQTLLAGATRAYLGVSPALVEELCLAAGVLPSAEPCTLSPEVWQTLHDAWQRWLTQLQTKSFTPSSCSSSNRFSVLGTYPQMQASVHQLLDYYYFSLQAGEVYGALYMRLAAAVKNALKKARGRVRSFEQQLEAAGDAAVVQRQGDLIVANLYRVPPGADRLDAEDWDTGQPVQIALDPSLPPMEVAEGLFKRARKLRRAVDAVQPLLEAAQQDLEYLESVEQELSQMPPGGSEQELLVLRQVQEELIESKVIKPPPEAALIAKAAAKGRKAAKRAQKFTGPGSSKSSAAAVGGGAAPRQYESPGGFTVLVGRNNKQNDVLSHQVAKSGDVWMHVRGLPGSHTVLRVSAGQQQPEERDLQFAADLAAWFSKGREAGKVDVIVARAEHLKKPRGAKPGQVLVTKEEGNIVARPSDSVAAGGGGGDE